MVLLNSKTWNKKQEGGFLGDVMAPLVASLIAPVASSLIQPSDSSLINAVSEKWPGKGKEAGFFHFSELPLIMKVLGKGVMGTGRQYNNMDHIDKHF